MFPRKSCLNQHGCADGRPIIVPQGLIIRQIHAAVTHGVAEIIMPVGPMDTIAFVKIHRVRDIRQIVTRSRHIGAEKFYIDLIFSNHGGVGPGPG